MPELPPKYVPVEAVFIVTFWQCLGASQDAGHRRRRAVGTVGRCVVCSCPRFPQPVCVLTSPLSNMSLQ